MYLHVGQNQIIKTKEIIGIFDIDTCSISPRTRLFFKKSEDAKKVVNVSFELPKSFIVTENKEKNVFISQLSTATLKKRWDDSSLLQIDET